jgi:NADPH:quinone reductase-like Zn-dependent oxidoreductase
MTHVIEVREFGPPEVLTPVEVPAPTAGPGVDPGLAGQRVVVHTGEAGGSGGYAGQAVVPADRVVPVPDEVSLADAVAVLNDGATALGLMAGTGVLPGESVLILGAAGGLGLLLAQLARAAGGHVVAALPRRRSRRPAGRGRRWCSTGWAGRSG